MGLITMTAPSLFTKRNVLTCAEFQDVASFGQTELDFGYKIRYGITVR